MGKGVPNNTHNLNGRPKGVPNKVNREVREILKAACEGTIEELPNLLAQIDTPEKRIDALTKLLPYFASKLQTVTIESKDDDSNEVREMIWRKKATQ